MKIIQQNLGKGSLWMVEQRFRPCLIQALQKTTHPQYSKFLHKLNIAKKSENAPTRFVIEKFEKLRKR